MVEEHTLEVDSIIKTIGERKILSDVFLSCRTGEVVGILGKNGSGKSTLLKIIFGSEDTEDKSIRVDGIVYRYLYRQGNLIAYLPRQSFLPSSISVKKIIKVFIEAGSRAKILNDDRIGQYKNKRVAELSGGELRYLEVFLLLNLNVTFVLLDEPFSGIEPLYQDKIIELIREYKHSKGVIITDHVFKKIIEVSDSMILLNSGMTRKVSNLTELEDYNYVPRGTFSGNRHSDEFNTTGAASQETEFEIDKQTLKDIDLFDQGRRGPAFNLFNHVKTTGGGDRLEGMFKTPITSLRILEDRRNAIRFFHERAISLKVSKQQLDMIERYLFTGIPLLKKNHFDTLLYAIRNRWKQTGNHYTISSGISNLVQLLRHLYDLGTMITVQPAGPRLDDFVIKLNELVLSPEISGIVLSSGSKPITSTGLAKCDNFFRVQKKALLRIVLDLVYELDVYQAAAVVVGKYGFCFPNYSAAAASKVSIVGLFNPLLSRPVPNDFEIREHNNLCFITGANMSGKSTFMKSFALSLHLAHIGFPVPASMMETTIFNGLVTTINLADNIALGYSHFYSEVRRIKEVALKIKEKRKMVVIFDELFRGTNVKDAADASLLIISAFSKIEHCIFLISTHIVEIADELKSTGNIFFSCFESRLEADVPIYSYKINPCISRERLGMSIVRNEGIVEILEGIQRDGKT